ncbi:hypothetical protein MtrunA17_Chr6g0452381 [Medicago truncatula]|uniref:Transmembrane protein n=1 Tax=Medicago truncatula TaxID=3880 RepID=A0A396H9M1_MEDTR|nr:hypothetical protein MtrunA17_Chr6g0452381 [Medicago truncatula]
MILSDPHADQIPSIKFNKPERVTLLSFFSSFSAFFIGSFFSSFSTSSFSFFFFLCPVRSREQSISSITIIDLLDVSIKSLFNSLLSLTIVNSRSYTS